MDTDQENTAGSEILAAWGKRTGGPSKKEKTDGKRYAKQVEKIPPRRRLECRRTLRRRQRKGEKHKDNAGNGKTKDEIKMGDTQNLPSQ